MQLTRAADYAVRVMIHLASQPEATFVSKALLAEAADAPESFLAKILQSLARAGLVQVRRGVVGGFSLQPRGSQASLLDVVEAIDGPIALNICLTSGIACQREVTCPAHQVWLRAQSAMLLVLQEAKIAEMIQEREPERALHNIKPLTSKQRSEPASSQGKLQKKARPTVRTHSAPDGAARTASRNQNNKI
jgi:Rrf2 family protein